MNGLPTTHFSYLYTTSLHPTGNYKSRGTKECPCRRELKPKHLTSQTVSVSRSINTSELCAHKLGAIRDSHAMCPIHFKEKDDVNQLEPGISRDDRHTRWSRRLWMPDYR